MKFSIFLTAAAAALAFLEAQAWRSDPLAARPTPAKNIPLMASRLEIFLSISVSESTIHSKVCHFRKNTIISSQKRTLFCCFMAGT